MINALQPLINHPFHIINQPYPSLLHLPRSSAIISSHLLLNRSHANAIKAFHDRTGNIIRHCEQCPPPSPLSSTSLPIQIRNAAGNLPSPSRPDEDQQHIISQCNRYSTQRNILKSKLNDLLNRIHDKQLFNNNDNISLLHITLSSIPILSLIPKKDLSLYYQSIGSYLEYINSIRKI